MQIAMKTLGGTPFAASGWSFLPSGENERKRRRCCGLDEPVEGRSSTDSICSAHEPRSSRWPASWRRAGILSCRHAATALGVSQSKVSDRIKDLEDVLDTMLFERRHRGVRPPQASEPGHIDPAVKTPRARKCFCTGNRSHGGRPKFGAENRESRFGADRLAMLGDPWLIVAHQPRGCGGSEADARHSSGGDLQRKHSGASDDLALGNPKSNQPFPDEKSISQSACDNNMRNINPYTVHLNIFDYEAGG